MDHTCGETNTITDNHCSDLQPRNQFTFVSWSANFNKLLDLNFNFCWGWLSRSFFGLLGCSASSEINKKKQVFTSLGSLDNALQKHNCWSFNAFNKTCRFACKFSPFHEKIHHLRQKKTNSQVGLMFLSLCVCQVAALEMEDNLLCYIQDEQMSNKCNPRFPYLVVMKR